ncbi:MAG: hypothetical protein MSC53_04805 [Arcanobacterium sp.]|nr:hypothetical protein [Arcanobacterium sp.]
MAINNTLKRVVVVLTVGALLLISAACAVFILLDRKIDAEREEFAANSSWTYNEVKNGDQIDATYTNKEPLYLFASRDLIETGYDFNQCALDGASFNTRDSHFNLPAKSGTALFLVAEFDRAASENAKLSCKSVPEKGLLAIGFQKAKGK